MREARGVTALRVLVHAIGAGVLVWPLATSSGVIAAVVGAALGSASARWLAPSSLRAPAVIAIGLGGLALAAAGRALVVGVDSFASALGPAGALVFGDVWLFALGALALSVTLRTLSSRRPALRVIEASLVGLGFAALLVAHRHGAIHRPYELADPMLTRGEDPTLALLVVGALGALTVVLLFLSERSFLRSTFHIGVALALLLLVLGTTALVGMPAPPVGGDGLGLRDDEGQGEGRGGGGQGQGGERDELEFRDEYDSSGNQAPVAVVLLHDDHSPESGVYYFRQGAFSQYNGRRLVATTRAGVDEDLVHSFPAGEPVAPSDPPELGADRGLVETTVALLADHNRPVGLESPVEMVPADNPNPSRFRRTYRVRSAVLTADTFSLMGRTAGDPRWDSERLAHYTYAPSDPRYAQLAERIVEGLPDDLRHDPMLRALAITQYLSRHGTYSLRSRHADAQDPTGHFLFGDLTGYCVHFAHAAVYLMRSIGLPARVATGYAVPEASRQGGSAVLLRGGDSHAWPEVHVAGAGWIVADVTPETVLDAPPGPPDPQLQRLLGEMARGESPLLPENLQPPRALAELARDARGPVLYTLLFLLLGALVTGYGVKIWRRLSPHIGAATSRPRLRYRASVDALAEAGLRRDWGESREAFARRMSDALPSLRSLTAAHLAAAFGRGAPETIDAPMIESARRLRRELGRVTPLWRRLLGLIHPFSWIGRR